PAADGEDDAVLDLRVDDAPEPLAQLRAALGIAQAFAPMWQVIRGPACRGPVAPSARESDEAIAVLDVAQRAYGPHNLEPTFWRAVALWRGARQEEAVATIAVIARGTPGWATLFDDVVSRWSIPGSRYQSDTIPSWP